MKLNAPVIGVCVAAVAAVGALAVSVLGSNATVGMGLPSTLALPDAYPVSDHATGEFTLHVSAYGCFTVRLEDGDHLLVWPREWRQDDRAARRTDGARLTEGSLFAAELDLTSATGPLYDAFLAQFGSCLDDTGRLAIITSTD